MLSLYSSSPADRVDRGTVRTLAVPSGLRSPSDAELTNGKLPFSESILTSDQRIRRSNIGQYLAW
jgi:hypothetical protein